MLCERREPDGKEDRKNRTGQKTGAAERTHDEASLRLLPCQYSIRRAEAFSGSQIRYYTKLIQEKEHWIWAGIYADEAQSGTKMTHREQFLQMIHDCEKGKIDLILTKSITRFARNTVDSISTIRMLKDMGVEVYFEKEKISTFSEKSEQLLTILSSIAQSEAENISANSKWAVQRRFQNGT